MRELIVEYNKAGQQGLDDSTKQLFKNKIACLAVAEEKFVRHYVTDIPQEDLFKMKKKYTKEKERKTFAIFCKPLFFV